MVERVRIGVKVKPATAVRRRDVPGGTSRIAAVRDDVLLKSLPTGVTTMSTMVNGSTATAGDGGAV